MSHKNLAIRNSTAEFLIFTAQSSEESIEVKYADETVWLTQKMMAKLFEVAIPTINEHLKNIYQNQELDEESTIRKFLTVQNLGNYCFKRICYKRICFRQRKAKKWLLLK